MSHHRRHRRCHHHEHRETHFHVHVHERPELRDRFEFIEFEPRYRYRMPMFERDMFEWDRYGAGFYEM